MLASPISHRGRCRRVLFILPIHRTASTVRAIANADKNAAEAKAGERRANVTMAPEVAAPLPAAQLEFLTRADL
jgi:hypothetical protein